MEEVVRYIISFLLYGHSEAAGLVGYTSDVSLWHNYKVVIIPNGHLGVNIVPPSFDSPQIDVVGTTAIIYTDIVYNTFFFVSRAEELINSQRDCHGRFCAKYSMLGQNNRLQIPLVDEYAHILLKLLCIAPPQPHYNHIWLTHDIDTVAFYRHLRGFLGGVKRGESRQAVASLKDIRHDPAYTFPWIIDHDALVQDAEVIYFVKQTLGRGFDYPQYNLHGQDYLCLKQLLEKSGAEIGLHSSYYGVSRTKFTGNPTLHRSHYLNCSIETMQSLAERGITDDFTMAFPDYAGFRLQTSRSVRWINPKTMQLTPLTLHPLTVMDCTLSSPHYMNLQTEGEAYFFCEQLFNKVRQYAGDINLLWHNTSFSNGSYHAALYPKLLKGLRHYSAK